MWWYNVLDMDVAVKTMQIAKCVWFTLTSSTPAAHEILPFCFELWPEKAEYYDVTVKL